MKKLTMLCMYYDKELVDTDYYPYLNIQCGEDQGNIKLKMQGDAEGNPFSKDNRFWSEITGLYWAWKNVERTEYIGLCSYRRFFNFKQSASPVQLTNSLNGNLLVRGISYDDVSECFKKFDVILPVEYTYSKSIQEVCELNYRAEDFQKLESYIYENNNDYYDAYKMVMYKKNKMIGHNMFIMRYDDFQSYCNWVFGILVPLSREIDASEYPLKQVRVFGYMHELLLAVYIEKKSLKVKRSQLLYVNDSISKVRFNSIRYRFLCEVMYSVKKLLSIFTRDIS